MHIEDWIDLETNGNQGHAQCIPGGVSVGSTSTKIEVVATIFTMKIELSQGPH
jgi:hypothetical protein